MRCMGGHLIIQVADRESMTSQFYPLFSLFYPSLPLPLSLPAPIPPHPQQEDMDSMQKELETWRTENGRHAEALRKEERYTVHVLFTGAAGASSMSHNGRFLLECAIAECCITVLFSQNN